MTLFELHTHLKHAGFNRWGISPARLYTKNEQGQTPLDFLSDECSEQGLQALAVTKYDFSNKAAFATQSPAFNVIESEAPNAVNVLRILFDHGLRINATDHHGNNALHLACEQGLKTIAMLLIEKGIDYTSKNDLGQTAFDVIPEAAEGFMVPALNRAIKHYKKAGLAAGISAISNLFHNNPVFHKQKKASE